VRLGSVNVYFVAESEPVASRCCDQVAMRAGGATRLWSKAPNGQHKHFSNKKAILASEAQEVCQIGQSDN